VGLVLDCCFDPLYQLGDVDSAREAIERIQGRLKKNKITQVITGCTNCRKALSMHLPDIKVEHVLEVLHESFELRTPNSELRTFYHRLVLLLDQIR
jgi:Fe-S oxidoreductase